MSKIREAVIPAAGSCRPFGMPLRIIRTVHGAIVGGRAICEV